MKGAMTPVGKDDTPITPQTPSVPVAPVDPPAPPMPAAPDAIPTNEQPVTAPSEAVPFTAEHQTVIEAAQQRAKKIRNAAFVAAFNGWSTAVFAGFTCLYAVVAMAFGNLSVVALVIGAGLSIVAYNELRGRRMLQQFNLRGPILLGWNQIGFLAMITVYCAFRIFQTLTGDGEYDQAIRQSPELAEVLGPIDGMVQWAFLATYALVFVVSAVFMGGNAIYYFTRRKHVRAYLNETPAWVVDLLQRTAR